MNTYKSKIGFDGWYKLFFYLSIFFLSIWFLFLLFTTTKTNHSIILVCFILTQLVPPNIFLLFFYYNTSISIDKLNNTITIRKLFGKKVIHKVGVYDRYVLRETKSRIYIKMVHFIDNDRVIFSYTDTFNSNWSEIEMGLKEIGVNEVSYEGSILYRGVLGKNI